MFNLKKYFKLIKIWESNNGREYGWYLKIDNKIVAELVDVISFDMFWDSYLVAPKTNSLISDNRLDDFLFWNNIHSKDFSIENKIIKYKTRNVIFNIEPNTKRISVRGLYIPIRSPKFFDLILTTFLNIIYKKSSPSNFNVMNKYNNWFTSYSSSAKNNLQKLNNQTEKK